MNFRPPFYNPPYFYNPTYKRIYFNNFQYKQPHNAENNSSNESTGKTNIKASNTDTRKSDDNNEFIEVFGIKLFFDDILILCLLFFLYKQNVNDPLLFIALLLLLLS